MKLAKKSKVFEVVVLSTEWLKKAWVLYAIPTKKRTILGRTE
jgi:hypothetical protein